MDSLGWFFRTCRRWSPPQKKKQCMRLQSKPLPRSKKMRENKKIGQQLASRRGFTVWQSWPSSWTGGLQTFNPNIRQDFWKPNQFPKSGQSWANFFGCLFWFPRWQQKAARFPRCFVGTAWTKPWCEQFCSPGLGAQVKLKDAGKMSISRTSRMNLY